MMEVISMPSLLLLWFGVSSAQKTRLVNVPEGDDALLPCILNSGQSIDKFDWRKDNGKEGMEEVFTFDSGSHFGNGRKGQSEQFTDRVVFFEHELKSGNASIKIKNTRLEDNGTYTCGLVELHRPVHVRLNVGGVLKIRNVTGAARVPYIQTIHDEITWRLLECKAQGVPEPEVEWRNSNGKVLAKHVPEIENVLFHVKLEVKVSKSDSYTCVVTQWDIYHQINKTMKVSIPDVIVVEGDDALLPCALDSKENIKNLEFSWRKGNEQVFLYNRSRVEKLDKFKKRLSYFESDLETGNASIKIHKTQKSDSGRYICNFPDIQKSYIILYVVGKENNLEFSTGSLIGSIVGTAVIMLVVVAVIIGVLCAKRRLVLTSSKRDKTSTPETTPFSS